ncbi:MAG: tetratricopeptide repeat protein [Burkholderiales bacterium]
MSASGQQTRQHFGAALQHHQAGRLAQAEALYRRVLAVQPRNAAVLNLLGIVVSQTGRHDDAANLIGSAIEVDPKLADYHHNLGNVLRDQGKFEDAAAAYRHALQIKPDYAEVHNSLGLVRKLQGKPDDATECFKRAVALKQDYVDAHNNMGVTLRDRGFVDEALACFERALLLQPNQAGIHLNLGATQHMRQQLDAAIACYERACALRPDLVDARYGLAVALMEKGESERALAHFEQVLRAQPDNPEVRHIMDALRHVNTERAPVAYVRQLFDRYAPTFDQHLVEKLNYHIPELLLQTLCDARAPAAGELDVLDLGCGTGLFGLQARQLSRSMVGIDLSRNMLEQARRHGVYDDLVESDLIEYLANAPAASFDLVAATDVFVYLGDLSVVFEHVHRILRSGGRFAFSVEGDNDTSGDYVLHPSGRYLHAASYIQRLSRRLGFAEEHSGATPIRWHDGVPANGYIFLLRKAEAPAA